ncbi:RHS repeat-associated core domain-containing protein [Pseudomonas sp. Irchel s3b2]|uniref:RHS repeat-associated core domain-containing protein n=1 Tax=Pseudomonas sp. Irchel s3b2 TaxID=2009073 RepID=UPI000BA2D874|nr:RHS repeat-associated core domain-containing protein [Pseudomonas sp. Irchel s3b2]
MIRDEEGRVLDYDALGRLTQVSALPGETPSGYRYDPLDTLTGRNGVDGPQESYYQNGELVNHVQGSESSRFIRGNGVVLAEHQAGAVPKKLLLAQDHKNSPLCEVDDGTGNDIAYSAYGHRSSEMPVKTNFGYNGELREAYTGWYLLGNGYRAFNTMLMRFHSPDNLSPFGAGGLNTYTYVLGNPVKYSDPTGNMPLNRLLQVRKISTPAPAASQAQRQSTSRRGDPLAGWTIHTGSADPGPVPINAGKKIEPSTRPRERPRMPSPVRQSRRAAPIYDEVSAQFTSKEIGRENAKIAMAKSSRGARNERVESLRSEKDELNSRLDKLKKARRPTPEDERDIRDLRQRVVDLGVLIRDEL